MSRVTQIMGALSQLANATFFKGNNNESISARSYREGYLLGDPKWNKRRLRINKLFSLIEKDHCKKAYLNDAEWAKAFLNCIEDSNKATV